MTNETNKSIQDQIIEKLNEVEPMLRGSAEEISLVQDRAMREFQEVEKEIKEDLINNPSVPEEDLERIYLESIQLAKNKIFENTAKEIKEIEAKYLKMK
jgi:hypothetical protein